MVFFIERMLAGGWSRVSGGIADHAVACNLLRTLAEKHGDSKYNYSILVEFPLSENKLRSIE